MLETQNLAPLLLSQSDSSGGAARAALRLHNALQKHGVSSHMQVGSKKTDLPSVTGPSTKAEKAKSLLRPQVAQALMRLQKTDNPTLHSPAFVPSRVSRSAAVAQAEVVHMHWICGEYISIADIGRINRPLVWTLHDMWAFCGAEHYAPDGPQARWRHGYRDDADGTVQGGLDLNKWAWKRKRRAWRKPIHIVSPSRWLADCAKDSALMHDWPVSVVPNVLDTQQFRPWPKAMARDLLGLPQETKLVLFGAIGGGKDPRKGWDLLQTAMAQLAAEQPGMQGVIFGQSAPEKPPQLGLPLHWLGHLHDDATLALVYSAADVTVVPSRQENLPQAGTEAQSCGCPVVAFNCTGLPDVVEDRVTGYLAQPYAPDDLAAGIRWVLEDDTRHASLGEAARARALRLWSPDVVVPQYLSVYQQAIEQRQSC